MFCPVLYRTIGDFHKYYSGEKKAPVLTIVIGGNHEASDCFAELYFGGWLAPNIDYLGDVGVVRHGPYRVAGLSGIYNSGTYQKPRSARLPYDRNEIRNVYHVTESDVKKLLQIEELIDICLSHDWPRCVEWHGEINHRINEEQKVYGNYMKRTHEGRFCLGYDEESLAVLRSSSDLADNRKGDIAFTDVGTAETLKGTAYVVWIRDNLITKGSLDIPDNFEIVASVHDPLDPKNADQ